jgi:hypothetical protein
LTLLGTRKNRTIAIPLLFVAVSIALVAATGVRHQRDILITWVLLGIACAAIADPYGHVRRFALDWLPFGAILLAYDSLRGLAGHVFKVHFLPQIQFDRLVGGGTTPTVELQHWLWHGHVVWYDVLCWLVYLTHFAFTPLLAVYLWFRNRARFRTFALNVTALAFAALLTYGLYPAAPPWLASRRHLIGPVTRLVPAVWASLPMHWAGGMVEHVYRLVEHGYQYANNVAAVPSLHAAFSLLVAITVWPQRRWLRPVVAAYPIAMAFSIVYTGEHYVMDVFLGWLYTVAAVASVRAVRSRLAARAPAWGIHAPTPSDGAAVPVLLSDSNA